MRCNQIKGEDPDSFMVHPPIHPQSIFGYECVIRLEIVKVEKFTEYSKIPGKVKNV